MWHAANCPLSAEPIGRSRRKQRIRTLTRRSWRIPALIAGWFTLIFAQPRRLVLRKQKSERTRLDRGRKGGIYGTC